MVNNFTVRLEELSVLSEVGKSVTAVVTWDPSDLSGKNITLILHMCTEANTPYTCFVSKTIEILVPGLMR